MVIQKHSIHKTAKGFTLNPSIEIFLLSEAPPLAYFVHNTYLDPETVHHLNQWVTV